MKKSKKAGPAVVPGRKVVAVLTFDEGEIFRRLMSADLEIQSIMEQVGRQKIAIWKLLTARYGLDMRAHVYHVDSETKELIEAL